MKNKLLKLFQLIVLGVFLMTGCDPRKEFNEYYEDKRNQKTIFELLNVDTVECSMFAEAAERAGYKDWLDKNNVATVFAPTDSAFREYLKEKNVTSISQLDTVTLKAIVEYSILPDIFYKREYLLTVNGSSTPNGGLIDDTGYGINFKSEANRRYTLYHAPEYYDTVYQADDTYKVYLCYNVSNKYLPINTNLVTPADPNDIFLMTGTHLNTATFNVSNARSFDRNGLVAKNGAVYRIDKVLTPLLSPHEALVKDTTLSYFRKYLDRYAAKYDLKVNVLTYKELQYSVTTAFEAAQKRHPNEVLYVKYYDPALIGNLYTFFAQENTSNNNGSGEQQGRTVGGMWAPNANSGKTMAIPNNAAMLDMLHTYYPTLTSLDQISKENMCKYLRNCISPTWVKPSLLKTKYVLPEKQIYSIDFEKDVVSTIQTTNGQLYVLRNIIPLIEQSAVVSQLSTNLSYSVHNICFGKFALNDLKTNDGISKFLFLLLTNSNLRNVGITTNSNGDVVYKGKVDNTNVDAKDIIKTNYFRFPVDTFDKVNFKGYGFIQTESGQYINYNNGILRGGGNVDLAVDFNATDNRYFVNFNSLVVDKKQNGNAYSGVGYPLLPGKSLGAKIKSMPLALKFYNYLVNNNMYLDGNLQGDLGLGNYTVFIPSNEAMDAVQERLDNMSALDRVRVLRNHFVINQYFSTEKEKYPVILNSTSLDTTIRGNDIYFMLKLRLNTGSVQCVKTDRNGVAISVKSEANLMSDGSNLQEQRKDIIAKDATIHIIDNVLFY